jgi:hypothetical protein
MTVAVADSLLEEALPRYDVNEVHSLEVPAPPDATWEAVMAVKPLEVRLLAPLMAVRALPALLTQRNWVDLRPRGTLIEGFLGAGFLELGSRSGEELAVGAIGRFWSLTGNRPIALESAEEFRDFDEPGYAKAAMDFTLEPAGSGTRVRTETRVAGTDPEATRLFRCYWRAIYPGSALIRISLLNAIRRRAQRADS